MHFALVKKIWGPFFDHFVDLQILTIWGQRSGSDPQPKKIGSPLLYKQITKENH